MKKWVASAAFIFLLTVLESAAYAVLRLHGIEDFTIGRIALQTDAFATNEAYGDGVTTSTSQHFRRWGYVGAKPTSQASLAVMQTPFGIADYSGSQCINATTNLARTRYSTAPLVDAYCTSGSSGVFHGSVSFTKTSCVYSLGDQFHSHSKKPRSGTSAARAARQRGSPRVLGAPNADGEHQPTSVEYEGRVLSDLLVLTNPSLRLSALHGYLEHVQLLRTTWRRTRRSNTPVVARTGGCTS